MHSENIERSRRKSMRQHLLIPFLFFLLSFSEYSQARDYFVNGQLINDDRVAELITVITSTSPTTSIPSVKMLMEAQTSLYKIPAFRKCKKIIVFDGIRPNYADRTKDYENYKLNVQILAYSNTIFSNTELAFCDSWVHLSGTLREALKWVTTPYIFVYQHDDKLIREFDLNGCIASMMINPNLKWIQLARHKNTDYSGEMFSTYFGPVDNYIEGGSFVPLTRCFGWSDYANVSTVDYYQNFVLPKCGKGFMEGWLLPALKDAVRGKDTDGINKAHQEFGCYFYGNLNDGNYVYHMDGRGIENYDLFQNP